MLPFVKSRLSSALRMVLLTLGLGAALILQALVHSTVAFLVVVVAGIVYALVA
ncbi:MAG: hypothetical protein JWN65_1598 [Solirubrobacterales bacterium]|nr:hypothetical protein [Solirubrobacterales bacterium]